MIGQGRQTKTLEIALDRGPQIVEAKRGEPLKDVRALEQVQWVMKGGSVVK